MEREVRMSSVGKTCRFATAVLSAGAIATDLSAAEPRFTPTQICKAGIALVMGRDPATMKIERVQKKVVFLSYFRAGDRKRWTYKCKLEGRRILWGADAGRWRTHPADSVVTFDDATTWLTVVERFGDGSSARKTFTVQQLGK
jgi:hypothetical protein